MVRAGKDITQTHQQLIDLAIDSMENDEHIEMPDFLADDATLESIDHRWYAKV
jgi:hypothetical protein